MLLPMSGLSGAPERGRRLREGSNKEAEKYFHFCEGTLQCSSVPPLREIFQELVPGWPVEIDCQSAASSSEESFPRSSDVCFNSL